MGHSTVQGFGHRTSNIPEDDHVPGARDPSFFEPPSISSATSRLTPRCQVSTMTFGYQDDSDSNPAKDARDAVVAQIDKIACGLEASAND